MMDWTGLREGQETGGKLPTPPPQEETSKRLDDAQR